MILLSNEILLVFLFFNEDITYKHRDKAMPKDLEGHEISFIYHILSYAKRT